MKNVNDLINELWKELGENAFSRFDQVGPLTADHLKDSLENRPGVYIWLYDGMPRKVGKHSVSARWRALQHLEAQYDGAFLPEKSKGAAVLIVTNADNNHWILAVEAYLESSCRQENFPNFIKSKRIG